MDMDALLELLEKPLSEWSTKEYTIAILGGIAAGTLLVAVLAAPNLAQAFTFLKAKTRKERYRVAEKMRYLERRGYIEKIRTQYELTTKGQRYLNEVYVWNFEPTIAKRWNGNWHFVAFDIPGKKRYERARQALRMRLLELGFVRYQDSLFVHRHNVRNAVEVFAEFYGILPYLSFIEASWIDNEQAIVRRCPLYR